MLRGSAGNDEYSRLSKVYDYSRYPDDNNDEEDMPITGRFIDFRNFKYHWIDTALTVILWLVGALVQYAGAPFHRFFTERDPTLSYPLINTVWVPTWLLFVLCLIIPGIIIATAQVLLWRRFGDVRRKHRVAKFFLAQMVLFQALGLTLFLTSLSKVFFGRQRPNFYAMCNYKGYRDALDAQLLGDNSLFLEYLNKTTPNQPGDVAFCLASKREVAESMFSHPSGHASLTFAGMGFLSLFLHHLLLSHKPTRRHHLWKAIVFAVPMFVAVIVAATRTRDYWHNYDDTIMGGLIGFGSATLAFLINYSGKKPHNEYIGHLFSEGGQSDVETGIAMNL